MGLLHKNLILAGIASMAMVGVLGSSNASALDGFSFSDIISQQQAQREQALSYLTNPFGMSVSCESTNPDSTISCNESPSSNLLFNRISDGEKLWGHDGKGVVFTDNNNLVDGNPQLATAKRGDILSFSTELISERYYDDEETTPISSYMIYGLLSDGLSANQSSVVVKVDGEVLSSSTYELAYDELTPEQAAQFGYDFVAAIAVIIPWSANGTFLYNDGAIIELSYQATIEDNAPSEVFSRGAYIIDGEDSSINLMDTDYQATAMIDGNILIRRVDENGNPLAGAKYTVTNVTASRKNT